MGARKLGEPPKRIAWSPVQVLIALVALTVAMIAVLWLVGTTLGK